jgi:undecaprenyl-diphosphatase
VILDLVLDLATMALAVAGLYFGLGAYVRHEQPNWSEAFHQRRFAITAIFVLGVCAIKVSEDVLGRESGPVDSAILLFVHGHVSERLTGFFRAVTFSASATSLFPSTVMLTIALLYARRRSEALLVAASVIAAALVVYGVKLAVGRARPALWDTEAYWGSSFPSGHTLVVAAFATAAALCVSRLRPEARRIAVAVAIVWIFLVAMSRLVLGVHWPTDVLVAACVGAFLALAISVAIDMRRDISRADRN